MLDRLIYDRQAYRIGKREHRRLMLFFCSYLRGYWASLNHDDTREAVVVAERVADGEASEEEVAKAYSRSRPVPDLLSFGPYTKRQQRTAWAAVSLVNRSIDVVNWWHWNRVEPEDDQSPRWASLLREVCGKAFSRQSCEPRWRTPVVDSLAVMAYAERVLPSGNLDLARLAVLSDALEEAGCTDADILAHLRSPGPHVRGCWALDLILGKE
jgi:hypothetical protein